MASPVAGRLLKIFTDKGHRVKKGDRLFLLEAEPDNYAYLAAKANYQQAVDAEKSAMANLI